MILTSIIKKPNLIFEFPKVIFMLYMNKIIIVLGGYIFHICNSVYIQVLLKIKADRIAFIIAIIVKYINALYDF